MRILVCGGRQFEDAGFLWKALDLLNTELPVSDVIRRHYSVSVEQLFGCAETEVGRGSA